MGLGCRVLGSRVSGVRVLGSGFSQSLGVKLAAGL